MAPPIAQLVKGEEHLLLPEVGTQQELLVSGTKQMFFVTSQEEDGS